MENYFDIHKRDRIIHEWLKKHMPDMNDMYVYIMSRYSDQTEINTLILAAFEAGIDFATIKNIKGE